MEEDPDQVHLPLRKVVSVGVGNALEFYDFLTFTFFSIQIGHSFFPQGKSLLYTLATFGVGFATRPLGGIVIGRYGDRAGRRPAMMLSFTLMGVAILGVALTPSYSRIGVAAPILLVAFRLLQGFALGGEVGPSTAYLVEAAPSGRRGLYVAMQYATQDLAVLAAGIVGYVLASALSPEQLDDWGWRIAFLLGVAIVPLGLRLRRSLPETLHVPASAAGRGARAAIPVRVVLLGLFLLAASTIMGYVFDYISTFAQDSLKMTADIAFGATIVLGLAQTVCDVLSGISSDRFGRKPVMVAALILLFAITVPCFLAMTRAQGPLLVYAATALLGAVGSFASGPALVSIAESLPMSIRSGTLATLYAVAIACFGGTTQFLVKWLTDASGSPMAPAWYLTGALSVGIVAALAMRESAPRKVGLSRSM